MGFFSGSIGIGVKAVMNTPEALQSLSGLVEASSFFSKEPRLELMRFCGKLKCFFSALSLQNKGKDMAFLARSLQEVPSKARAVALLAQSCFCFNSLYDGCSLARELQLFRPSYVLFARCTLLNQAATCLGSGLVCFLGARALRQSAWWKGDLHKEVTAAQQEYHEVALRASRISAQAIRAAGENAGCSNSLLKGINRSLSSIPPTVEGDEKSLQVVAREVRQAALRLQTAHQNVSRAFYVFVGSSLEVTGHAFHAALGGVGMLSSIGIFLPYLASPACLVAVSVIRLAQLFFDEFALKEELASRPIRSFLLHEMMIAP